MAAPEISVGEPVTASDTTPTAPRRREPLTRRVLALAALLIPLNAWWLTETEYVRYTDNVTTQALFFNVISLLLLLVGVNRILRAVRPAWMFTPQEMVALYVIVAVASGLAGHDTLQILFTTLTFPIRNAGVQTDWTDKIVRHLPEHLIVQDKAAIDALYSGNSTLYRWEHVQPWLVPLGWWTFFMLLLVWTMLCLVTLFRRQWDAERLSYPIAEIPLQVIAEERTLFRTPLLWVGFAVGASFQMSNLIHALFPSFPAVTTGVHNFSTNVFPWSAAGPLPLTSYAFAYGLTFLLPTQLGFSVWFFFLLSRLELVGAAMLGYTEWGKFPYVQQQGVGAIFGFFLAIVWAARGHLTSVWRMATGDRSVVLDDSEEPLPYRLAVWGLIAGIGGLVCFAVTAGMQWHTALLYLGILFIIIVVTARIRAELGLPTFELYQVGADQVLPRIAGTNAWTHGDMTVMSLFFFLSRTHRQFPMQVQVDAMHLGRRTQTPLRSLAAVTLLASAFGIVAAFWAFLHATYRVGYESAEFQGPAIWAFGRAPWQKMEGWIGSPTPPDTGTVQAYLFGTFFTLFLSAMRARFVWWPFHPAGYLVSGSFGLFRLWLPIFLSWLVKVLLLRYGGLGAYRRALPFFLGLVLGEFAAGFLRSVLDLAFGLHLPAGSGIGGL